MIRVISETIELTQSDVQNIIIQHLGLRGKSNFYFFDGNNRTVANLNVAIEIRTEKKEERIDVVFPAEIGPHRD